MVCWKILDLGIRELTLLIDSEKNELGLQFPFKWTLLGSKRLVIMHQKIFVDVKSPWDSIFRGLSESIRISRVNSGIISLGFSNIPFWNCHMNWTLTRPYSLKYKIDTIASNNDYRQNNVLFKMTYRHTTIIEMLLHLKISAIFYSNPAQGHCEPFSRIFW